MWFLFNQVVEALARHDEAERRPVPSACPKMSGGRSACRAVNSLSIFRLVCGADFGDSPSAMKLIFFSGLLAFSVWTIVATETPKSVSTPSSESLRAQVTVENRDKGGFLPELKASDWAGTHLRDLVDMPSGMEGVETSNDAYRNAKHKQFQLEPIPCRIIANTFF
jgi:hypothetical protein